ncbi:GPI transamidase-like protein component Gpi16 [Mollisia scopiformis]|uniref:GPI transamidase-like protein component Gpi16 n=1 Tax=Mollisia scopiformis TaxID=149040 RepID=A0A194WYJ0_MOLSC|nr:GPI transamidase-like protein component Gpi16 [Mollisia scopiformis]KUJ12672.1 GPI transamidase-like protein component Gpi16 [Mollisia scopiformis]
MRQLQSLLFVIGFFFLGTSASDYHEQLLLRPLHPSLLLASFNFQSNTSWESFEQQNFRYFPRSLGQILQHANTRELHLRFSLGRWDAESWGARPWGGAREGGTGVELWAWVEAETDEEANGRWLTLTNALSGLFCASLNFIDSTRTTRPVMSFQPSEGHANSTLENLHLLHGTLPREVVCTENLTPFLKLLPCKGKAGISSLLDGHKLFDASWQSMSIDVRPICAAGESDCQLQITQTIDMVLDIQRSKRPRDNPIPRPVPFEELKCDHSKPYNSHDTCYPLDTAAQEEGWSLSQIFGHSLKGSCPLATDGVDPVCINVPHARHVFTSNGAQEHKDPGGFLRCFGLASEGDFDITLPQQDISEKAPLEQPLLYAERSFIGYGQERGGVQAILTNPSPTQSVDFVYMESIPWFMKLYLHTLKAKINGLDKDVIQEMYYRPALDRKRGTQLEVRILIPANSTVVLTYDFEKAILRYTEYPPDANRGFDIAPAVITIGNVSIRTTSLLLPLPTPDFSMPYNVIILTSTVMALSFGFVFNLLVRRFVAVDEADQWDVRSVRLKIAAAARRLLLRFRKRAVVKKDQ